ncbi:longevity assurance proteins LAG1/LAC1 [Aaosphaeria arxii CBS 175.79]|uniref:Longevity assurance proteins LAG1/LAC1 n=1 Tax=Aaosphaeria arxii CBS 175.79 TaxID=1450172 RepID=A0A6A5XR44_9PLEO|nr:longevity assurance proteins LAG1/LAC1 [Aaosphaeria arxii CBS 175.79]KAF2015652.1 longevity assurance proteins LAG1/LAC1 [Aaosphaeria arxii CBS 175.79]
MSTKVAYVPNGQVRSSDHAIETQTIETREFVARTNSPLRRTKKVEKESLSGSLCALICNHQIGIAINLVLLLFLTHTFFPRARRRTSKFFHLSYYNPDTEMYGCGTDDIYLVALWVVILTGMRAVVMDYFLDPLARAAGVKTKKGLARFKEQGWLIVYYTGSWTLGMYIMYHSEFWMNLTGMWEGWPHREIDGLFKWYYLVQWASYLQQNLSVNIEEKRKDYAQMFTHHIFTCALIALSYGYYHMRVGTVILCIMDFVDIILPTAKLLKYSGYSTACDAAFGLFVVAWFITRHVFFMMVCWSIYAHAPTAMAPGCYLADGSVVPMSSTAQFEALGGNDIWGNILKAYTDRNGTICWNPTMRYNFLGLLLSLQALLLLWFAMIIKVVWRVVSGKGADDVRSDDEGEDEELSVEEELKAGGPDWAPVEQDVGVEALNLSRKGNNGVRNYRRASNRSSGSRASGISIPGHGDRKELLGRIGCDKPT